MYSEHYNERWSKQSGNINNWHINAFIRFIGNSIQSVEWTISSTCCSALIMPKHTKPYWKGYSSLLHENSRTRNQYFNVNVSVLVNFRFEAIKPIGKVEIVQSPYVTESTRVALLLPAFEHQVDETLEFIALYEKTCMQQKDNTFLLLVLVYRTYSPSKANDDVFGGIKSLALELSDKYKTDGSRIAWLSIRLPESFDHLSNVNESTIMMSSAYGRNEILGIAVTDLALRKIGLDSLVMVCSNTMTFKADVLNRVCVFKHFLWILHAKNQSQ